MAYNSQISRTDAAGLIPESVSLELLNGLTEQSAALSLFRQVRMPSKVTNMPALSAVPTASWVNGDTGLKQTSDVAWANKVLTAEELAVIVPIPEAVLDDMSIDVWGQVRPLCAKAIGDALDAAVFFGTNKPASWPSAVVTAAAAAGNTVTRGTNNAAAGGIAQDFSDLFGKVESDGHDVNGVVADLSVKGRLRGARTSTGEATGEVSTNDVFGVPVAYTLKGGWGTSTGDAEAVVGDFSQGIVGIRQDFTYKLITEGVITDGSGAIQYNLPQQDMVALRVVFRVAFQVANTVRWNQATPANFYPFGALLKP